MTETMLPAGVVEAAHKALMSELFLVCQPNHGDVFSFMDDHPEVLGPALKAINRWIASPPPVEPQGVTEAPFVTRWNLTPKHDTGGETWIDREVHPDGQWVTYEDHALAQPEDPASLAKEGLRLEFQRIRDALANGLTDEAFETADRAMNALAPGSASLAEDTMQGEKPPHKFATNGPGIVGSDLCTICGKEREGHLGISEEEGRPGIGRPVPRTFWDFTDEELRAAQTTMQNDGAKG